MLAISNFHGSLPRHHDGQERWAFLSEKREIKDTNCAIFAHHFPPFLPQVAYYEKRGTSWRACVERRGVRQSKTFPTKAAAVAWAGRIEADIMAGVRGEIPNKTLADLLDRYLKDVSEGKKGKRWESVRIIALKRDRIAQERLRNLNATHVSDWRDRRLKAVSAASVRREWNLLSHACEVARREWKWLQINPFREATRPPSPQHRNRIFTDTDLGALRDKAKTPAELEAFRAVLFAVETGMRASEIFKCQVSGRVAHLADTKNGTRRDVPLSEEAVRLYGNGWTLTPATLDVHFRRIRDAAGLVDLHFHDTRRTAITRLSKKLNPLELASMVGHKDLKMLLVYYKESAEDIARKL